MNTATECAKLKKEIAKLARPHKASDLKRYLKSPFKVLGAEVSALRKVGKAFAKEHKDLQTKELWTLVWKLWRSGVHEERMLAIILLQKNAANFELADMKHLEKMLRESVNWDQIDGICAWCVAPIVARDKRAKAYLRKWAKDDNFWMRRSALLGQLPDLYRGTADILLFLSFAKGMLHEKEFFIRKAIGWCLRELSHSEPRTVVTFVNKNITAISPLSYREGTRNLSATYTKKLKPLPQKTKK